MSELHSVLAKFDHPKKSGSQWLARCPAHEDRTASLAIREGADGKVLVHCHAGCSTEAILNAAGLEEQDLFPESEHTAKREIDTYDYTDEQGKLLYQVVRYLPKDFRQRHPDGSGGWTWNMNGVRRVLYRLHDLQGKEAALFVEGEKDAKTGWDNGLTTTCNVGGAGKWTADYAKQAVAAGLKRAVIIPDADAPGLSHAHDVASSLKAAGLHVRLAILPDVGPKGDLTDYLQRHTKAELVALLRGAPTWTPEATNPSPPPEPIQQFHRTPDGKYRWALIPPGVQFTLDRVRRDRGELVGELTVHCDISGAGKTQGGTLMTADFNLSSARARQERAKLLAQRARTKDDVDWFGMLEEFCEQIFGAERAGAPAIRLDEGEPDERHDDTVNIDGLTLLLRHPLILFGDGGTAKSYLGLYLAGRLAIDGHRVLYADWELLPDEHRVRLRRLFGAEKPALWYVTCDKPLVSEQDRLLKTIRANNIDYMIVDSVAVACDGPPEAAEVATSYYRALRTLSIGSLNIAHTNRSEFADRKPFGSSFWHNLARSTWFCQRSEDTDDPRSLIIGLFNRKANLAALAPAISFKFHFGVDRTSVELTDVRDSPDLAGQLALWQRIQAVLATNGGAMTTDAIAKELDAKENTIRTAVRRRTNLFDRVTGADGIQRVRLVKGYATADEVAR